MTDLNMQVAEEFAGRMLNLFNDGMTAIMVAIGHRTKLFDTMAEMEPASSAAIAEKAGLNERYVREWLGNMVTSKLVEYDAASGKYRLPPEHAACLTRAAGTDNLAFFAQYIPVFGEIEDKVTSCFYEGGGVGYESYRRFQALMAEESAMVHDVALVDVILPLVPGLVDKLNAGISALDIGCGSGHAVNLMAKAFPNSKFRGVDISDEGLARAKAESKELGTSNATFDKADVAKLGETNQYDLVTAFDAIHDQVEPDTVLANIFKALKPGGTFLCVDIAASTPLEGNLEHPLAPALYAASTLHCMTVSLAGGGPGLGTMWGEQKAREMLAEAGFVGLEVKTVEGDIQNNYYICHKPA